MILSRIPREEIQAWERDEGVRLERWERRAIMALDTEYVTAMSPKPKAGKGSAGPPAEEED